MQAIAAKHIGILLTYGGIEQMSAENWGGSAAGGGLDFQAAVSALCMVHMACGTPLGWFASANDVPLDVSAETGGAGDDIAVTLADGSPLEVQAKRRLHANQELWNSLTQLCQRAHDDASFYGVLAVGPATSVAIRDQLARDIIRIGQGRTDDLSPHALTLTEKLSAGAIPFSACNRVRIQTVHVVEQDTASAQSAVAYLEHITTQPIEAWDRLKAEGLRLIKLRGRQDAVSIAEIIPGLRVDKSGRLRPAVVATQLLDWTLKTTTTFAIPAVDKEFSLDDDWIELKAHGQDDPEITLGSLEDALTRYHDGRSQGVAKREQDSFDAESLGYFVRQCVIVAGPGMGKTQLLRRIARLLARKREPSLIIRLRPLAERMRAGETFLEAALHIGLDASPVTVQDVQKLGMQNLTLLLDGLDESGTEQEEIAKAAVALTASFPRCRIVFATRPIGYETALLSKWRHYELVPIESSGAKRAVERLVAAAKCEGNTKIQEATASATSHLHYKHGHNFSARSPLLIALLASLALNEVVAAATREGLYEQLFKLIERMTANKRETIGATPAILSAFLQQLGWELTEQPYTDAERVLEACAQRLAIELNERPLKARAICDEALAFWERTGIVERVRFKVVEALTFVHKTFGEYAAAQYALSRSASERARLLTAIEPAQQWNEVIVFLSAMGLGSDLVQLALARAREGNGEAAQALRWARHSRYQLEPELAEAVQRQAWAAIAAQHSGKALSIGVDLVAALDKLSGGSDCSRVYREHPQWWTALVAWACFVRINPELLEFPALLTFMSSYAKVVDTRKARGGLELYNPVGRLWEELLLRSVQEAVLRGVGAEEQKFLDRLKESLGTHSMGFVREFMSILGDAGVNIQLPWQEDLFSKYFNSEFFEQGRQDMLALLDAISEGSPEPTVPANAPLLHLSAFWYGTNLMSMEISAAVLAARDSSESEVRQIVKWAARLSSYDHRQLVAEAQAKIRSIREPGGVARSFDGLLSVDAPIKWSGGIDSSAMPVITKALLHPSKWIIYLAANIAEHLLTADDCAELVPQVLAESNGLGMAAAASLAVHFLGKERARDLIVARLKQPLNSGCQHLFQYLAEIWTPELDDQVSEILTPALYFGPRTAKAALSLARICQGPQRKALAPLLKDAYDYWLKNEGPYTTESGIIPESPRGDILTQLIGEEAIGPDDLFLAAKDRRTEVSKQAIDALLTVLSTSEAERNELVRLLQAGETLDSLLTACLLAHTPFSEQDVQSIAKLIESEHSQIRYAAVGILELLYLPPSEIRKWAEKLLEDPYQHLRDKGHERLAMLTGVPASEAP